MPFTRWALIAIICLSGGGCQSDQADKKAVIAAMLGKVRSQWTNAKQLPCFMADVKKSPYDDGNYSIFPLPSSILPKPFKICGKQFDAYYQVYDPDIAGNKATIDLDLRCGGMCGSGKTVILERTKHGWTLTEEQQRWIS